MPTPSHGEARPSEADHPQLDWAVATGFVYLRAGDWVPLLVEWQPPEGRPEAEGPPDPAAADPHWFRRGEWLPADLRQWVYVPPIFAELAERVPRMRHERFAVVLLARDHVAGIVRSEQWRATVRRAEMGPPVNLNEKRASAGMLLEPRSDVRAAAGLQHDGGPRAVIGVIDQGIAFANARFRNKGGTRIAYVWQQEFRTGVSPTSLGTEIGAAEIDAAMQAAHDDEDRVYRTLGGLRFDVEGYKPLARARTHGTHVLDCAAGADIVDDVRNLPIIAVDMPEHSVGDPAGSTLVLHAIWGLIYIVLRADTLRRPGEKLPVVVNISYGPHEGPHDGTSLFEAFADHLIDALEATDTPLRIVLAAGNARQSRVHAQVDVPAGGTRTLHWRLQPCGRTPSELQLWWPAGHALDVTLRSPTNEEVAVSAVNDDDEFWAGGWPVFAACRRTSVGGRQYARLCIAPTELDPRVTGGHAVAPSGVWSVELASGATVPTTVKAWIRRGDTPPGRRAKGRQSYFDEDDYVRHDASTRPVHYDMNSTSAVRRLGTLSGIATGRNTTVVGAYRRSDDFPAPYSSAGPHDNDNREVRAPTLLAPGDDSAVRRGILAAKTRSGSRARMNGTSVAAPHVTRDIAQGLLTTGTPPNLTAPPNPTPPLRPPKGPAAAGPELPFVAGHGLLP